MKSVKKGTHMEGKKGAHIEGGGCSNGTPLLCNLPSQLDPFVNKSGLSLFVLHAVSEGRS